MREYTCILVVSRWGDQYIEITEKYMFEQISNNKNENENRTRTQIKKNNFYV